MKTLSTTTIQSLWHFGRHGALLLALGGTAPGAFAQSFSTVSYYSTGTGTAGEIAAGDINGDGRLDVVTANSGTGASYVSVLYGQSSGGFAPFSSYNASTGTNTLITGIALGDVTGDGRLDIVVSYGGANTVAVLSGQAGGGFAAATRYNTGVASFPYGVALGDVNNDGRLDIVTANLGGSSVGSNAVGVLLGQAGGGFLPVSTYPAGTGNSPRRVVLGDVNGDGRLDIVTDNGNSTIGVLLGQASGGFATVATYTMGTYAAGVKLADVNNDGRLDIIATTTINFRRQIGVLLAQASGGFGAVSTYNSVSNVSVSDLYDIALGDVNGDGRLDVAACNNIIGQYLISISPGLVGGSFASYGTQNSCFLTGIRSPFTQYVQLGDVNGDGRLDVITSNGGTNTVGVFLNTGTYTPLATTSPTAAEVSLYPNPAHGSFRVQLPATLGPTRADLLNALGQTVRHQTARADFTFDTQGLAAGLYTLRLTSSLATLTKRVVVE